MPENTNAISVRSRVRSLLTATSVSSIIRRRAFSFSVKLFIGAFDSRYKHTPAREEERLIIHSDSLFILAISLRSGGAWLKTVSGISYEKSLFMRKSGLFHTHVRIFKYNINDLIIISHLLVQSFHVDKRRLWMWKIKYGEMIFFILYAELSTILFTVEKAYLFSFLCYTSGFGVINIYANSNYLSGSLSMFNSTTGRLHHLRVTWHSFASVYLVYRRSMVSRFPGTGKNRRRLPAFAATPTPVTPHPSTRECRAKG